MATYEVKLGRTSTLLADEDENSFEEFRRRLIAELNTILADIDARLTALEP